MPRAYTGPPLPRLPWSGLLSVEQLNRLKVEIPDFVICPGYTGRFASVPDEGGRVYVAGATGGLSHTKTILRRWASKADTDQVKWWLETMKDKSIEPVTCHQLLSGLDFDRWTNYHKAYHRAVGANRFRRHHARKRARIVEEKETELGVARELLGLSNTNVEVKKASLDLTEAGSPARSFESSSVRSTLGDPSPAHTKTSR
ncbi:hypothetical protein BDZ90DRAFT_234616 [Jaminaea rosea]|uniref:Uncharacterized protein n=1 Tax=Jaminaea rosea TaxID=1569628 RepID=A0A316UIG0_9BASI|nr:hypothetical protein BDZ90DRAFT_234616 [Jaminaea rosea]PWN25009.1 hypothetical protein BDZ90DRAFT_234616 [Jaminaea rosea]